MITLNKNSCKYSPGYTLIETLIYILIFSLLLVGAILSTYSLTEGSRRFENKIVREAEANFILRKFDGAVANIKGNSSGILMPIIGSSGTVLKITKSDNSVVIIDGSTTTLSLDAGSGPEAINSGRVLVKNFNVENIDTVNDGIPVASVGRLTT